MTDRTTTSLRLGAERRDALDAMAEREGTTRHKLILRAVDLMLLEAEADDPSNYTRVGPEVRSGYEIDMEKMRRNGQKVLDSVKVKP